MTRSFRFAAVAAAALLLVGVAGIGLVSAHDGATGVVKERMDLMKGIGDAMKRLAAMFQGEADYDADAVREAAETIRARGGAHMTALFPEDSLHKPSEALPTVWEDWAAFERYAKDLETFSAALAAAADNAFGPMHGQGMGPGSPRMGGPRMGRGPMMGGQGPGPMMGGPGHGPMMGGQPWGPDHPMNDPEALKTMPPMASFMRLSQTCNACHSRFRIKK